MFLFFFIPCHSVEQQTTSKEKILKKVRQALIFKSKSRYGNIDLDSPVFAIAEGESLYETFAREFTTVAGQFVICENKFDFIDKFITLCERRKLKQIACYDDALQHELGDIGIAYLDQKQPIEKMQAAITSCESLIARTGSVVVTSGKNSRVLTIYPPIHIVVAYTSQVVLDMKDALQMIRNKYGKTVPSMISVISGPSRTGDIEKTIVIGAHGPKEVFVFLIDDLKPESHNS